MQDEEEIDGEAKVWHESGGVERGEEENVKGEEEDVMKINERRKLQEIGWKRRLKIMEERGERCRTDEEFQEKAMNEEGWEGRGEDMWEMRKEIEEAGTSFLKTANMGIGVRVREGERER